MVEYQTNKYRLLTCKFLGFCQKEQTKMVALVLMSMVCFISQSSAHSLTENDSWSMRRLLNSTEIEPEKSVFEKIKEFYDDPNNMAMYGVLPLIVLVYGGFCVIYCVCKGYDDCKKKKNKKSKKNLLRNDDNDELLSSSSHDNNNSKGDNGDFRNHNDRNNPDRSMTRAAMAANVARSNNQHPYPNNQHHHPNNQHPHPNNQHHHPNNQHPHHNNQHPHPKKNATSTSDVRLAVERENSTPLPWAIPDDEALYPTKEKGPPPNAPAPASATEPKLNLKPLPIRQPDKPYKPPNRKPHPDMHMPPSPPPPYDYGRRDSVEEISMNPRRVNAVSNRSNDPRNSKAMNAMEQYALARQAAQLLRVEGGHPGEHGMKKPKRLVFVAE